MAEEEDKKGNGLMVIVILIVVVLAIAYIGLWLAKQIYRYSRSIVVALTFLMAHMAFFVAWFYFGDGEGDNYRSGWEVLKLDFLSGAHPFIIYLGFAALCFAYTVIAYERLPDETKALVKKEIEEERQKCFGLSFLSKLFIIAGAGYVGYKAGRAIGRDLT